MNEPRVDVLEQLRQELADVRARLAAVEGRRRRVRWVLLGLGIALLSATAFAQTLVNFVAGQPAVAGDVNANFATVKSWIETKTGPLGSLMPGTLLAGNSVGTTQLADSSITTTKLTDGDITNSKFNLDLRCPDLSRSTYGQCIWELSGGYIYTYTAAAAQCRGQNARLCTLAEVAAGWAVGLDACAYGWVADRSGANAFIAYPNQAGGSGCTAGFNSSTQAIGANSSGWCCK